MSSVGMRMAYDLEELKDGLVRRAHTFCEYLFPKGKFRAGNYSIRNRSGTSGTAYAYACTAPNQENGKTSQQGREGVIFSTCCTGYGAENFFPPVKKPPTC